jgi:hypothetical protein
MSTQIYGCHSQKATKKHTHHQQQQQQQQQKNHQ